MFSGQEKPRRRSLTTFPASQKPAGPVGGEGRWVGLRRGEATVGAVYLWSRRAAGCQSLQLLRSVAGEEIRAAGGAAQPLHQRGDDAAAAATHRLAHLASRRRKNKVRNFRKKEEKKRRWGGISKLQPLPAPGFGWLGCSRVPRSYCCCRDVSHVAPIHRYSVTSISGEGR